MTRKIQYLVLHTSAGWQKQPNGQWTRGGHLMDFFFAPKLQPNGKLLYKAKLYSSQADLPNERLPYSGISVRKAYPHGNGWLTGGYHKLIEGDGNVYNAYSDEIVTNGVRPSPDGLVSNSNCVHLNWIGGLVKVRDNKGVERLVGVDNRTEAQKSKLAELVLEYVHKYPSILVAGHYALNQKPCPLFNVPSFLVDIGVKGRNIYFKDPWGLGKGLK